MKVSAAVPDDQGTGEGALGAALAPQHDSAMGARELTVAMVLGLSLWITPAFFVLSPLYRALMA